MKETIDGAALIYCDGAFNTPNGKTAHGLVRFTERYSVLGVIDHVYAGLDAGEVLEGRPNSIPIFASLLDAMAALTAELRPKTLVIGLAPDGGRLPAEAKKTIRAALETGLNIDSGLHDFLYKDRYLMAIA